MYRVLLGVVERAMKWGVVRREVGSTVAGIEIVDSGDIIVGVASE